MDGSVNGLRDRMPSSTRMWRLGAVSEQKKMINPLVLSAAAVLGAAQRIETACYTGIGTIVDSMAPG